MPYKIRIKDFEKILNLKGESAYEKKFNKKDGNT